MAISELTPPTVSTAGDDWHLPPEDHRSFWSRPAVWVTAALIMLAITIGYFVLASDLFAAAPGGCGGG